VVKEVKVQEETPIKVDDAPKIPAIEPLKEIKEIEVVKKDKVPSVKSSSSLGFSDKKR
jgi:hypothetical protein